MSQREHPEQPENTPDSTIDATTAATPDMPSASRTGTVEERNTKRIMDELFQQLTQSELLKMRPDRHLDGTPEYAEYALPALIKVNEQNRETILNLFPDIYRALTAGLAGAVPYPVEFEPTLLSNGNIACCLVLQDTQDRNPDFPVKPEEVRSSAHATDGLDTDDTVDLPLSVKLTDLKARIPQIFTEAMSLLNRERALSHMKDFAPDEKSAQNLDQFALAYQTIEALNFGEAGYFSENGQSIPCLAFRKSEIPMPLDNMLDGLELLDHLAGEITGNDENPQAKPNGHGMFEVGEVLEHDPNNPQSLVEEGDMLITFPNVENAGELLMFIAGHMHQLRTELRAHVFGLQPEQTCHSH